jgi:hypothetical protein
MPIPLALGIAAGATALRGVVGAAQYFGAPKKKAAPKFSIPKGYEERLGRVKSRAAFAGQLPGQEQMEQQQQRITSKGISALEAAPSSTFTSDVASYLQKERDAMAGIGIKAAERKDQLQEDVLTAMKDKEEYQMEAYRDKLAKWEMGEQERLAQKGAGMQNMMGALSGAAMVAGTFKK